MRPEALQSAQSSRRLPEGGVDAAQLWEVRLWGHFLSASPASSVHSQTFVHQLSLTGDCLHPNQPPLSLRAVPQPLSNKSPGLWEHRSRTSRSKAARPVFTALITEFTEGQRLTGNVHDFCDIISATNLSCHEAGGEVPYDAFVQNRKRQPRHQAAQLGQGLDFCQKRLCRAQPV